MKKISDRGISRSLVFLSLGGLTFLIAALLTLNKIYNPKESINKVFVSFTDTGLTKSERIIASPRPLALTNKKFEIENIEVTPKEYLISQLVSSGRPLHHIAEDLLRLLPETKGSEQILIVSHLGDLAEGDQLHQLVSFLKDSSINQKAKENIFNIIYQCEPMQAASLLIQVIDDGVYEFASEAERGLSILLQADHGMDTTAWRSELEAERLKQLEAKRLEELEDE